MCMHASIVYSQLQLESRYSADLQNHQVMHNCDTREGVPNIQNAMLINQGADIEVREKAASGQQQ